MRVRKERSYNIPAQFVGEPDVAGHLYQGNIVVDDHRSLVDNAAPGTVYSIFWKQGLRWPTRRRFWQATLVQRLRLGTRASKPRRTASSGAEPPLLAVLLASESCYAGMTEAGCADDCNSHPAFDLIKCLTHAVKASLVTGAVARPGNHTCAFYLRTSRPSAVRRLLPRREWQKIWRCRYL